MCKYFAGRIVLFMSGAARSAGRVVSTPPYRDAVAVRPCSEDEVVCDSEESFGTPCDRDLYRFLLPAMTY